MGFGELSKLVIQAHKDGKVVTVWHPDPHGELLALPCGANARVLVGEPAFQHSDGTIIKPQN